jgi:hypothetical protein
VLAACLGTVALAGAVYLREAEIAPGQVLAMLRERLSGDGLGDGLVPAPSRAPIE